MVDYNKSTDEELVKLTLEKEDFFAYLIKRYEKKLLYYILRITNVSQEEAEDILQDSFIKAYINLNNFDTSLKFSSWLYRITHNQVISNYRKNQARPQTINLNTDTDSFLNLAFELDLDKKMDLDDLKVSINNLLNNLDLKYREVLVLKFLEDRSYNEISDILKKPLGTVASLINRAKQKLKEEVIKSNIKI